MDSTAARTSTTATAAGFDANRRDADVSKAAARRSASAPAANRRSAVSDTLRAAANAYVNDQDIVAAAVGPCHEMPDYNWLRRRTYWLRY